MLNSSIRKARSIADFRITERWPAKHSNILQLYSLPTPNGQKVSIMLEEIGLVYEPHKVLLNAEGVTSPEFLSLNPNNKIPAIIDPNGPEGNAIGLFESGAILVYLATKSKRLNGKTEAQSYEILQWLMFQMSGLGPMSGQLGYFLKHDGKELTDKRPLEHYVHEVKRLLNVIEQQLEHRDWLAGDYSIADIATVPWLNCLDVRYGAADITQLRNFKNLSTYMDRFNARPAVQKGVNVPEHSWD